MATTANGSRPPIVRLQVWLEVLLVIILLATCTVGRGPDANQVADEVTWQLRDGTDRPAVATTDDITQMCRLLAIIAAKEKVDLSQATTDGDPASTACRDGIESAPAP